MVARGEDSLPLSEINSLVTPELPTDPLGSVTLCGEGTGDDEKDRRTLHIWGGCCDACASGEDAVMHACVQSPSAACSYLSPLAPNWGYSFGCLLWPAFL